MRITEVLTESSKICPQCGMRGCPCKPGKCNCKPKPGYPKKIDEAANPAQQAAIAIAMKKAGKKPKSVAEGEQPGKSVTDAIQKVMPMAQEIWFHGSRATGSHRRNSDTDILVVVPDDLVGDQYLAVVRILQKLSAQFNNYDIQPTKSGTNIHRTAQEEGQLLWSNKQGVAEGTEKVNPLTNAVISFYKPVVDQIEPGAVDDYVKQAKELLNQAPDPTIRSRMLEIFKKGQKDPMIQGGVVTAIAAILTGGLLSSASRMGLSPAQTNILLQAVLNTVIPTIIARINNKSWRDTIKYTLASVGVGMTAAATLSEKRVTEVASNTIPTMGINIRSDGNIDYASLIVDGEKKYESRKTDSLRPYVGKIVGIVRTGNGPAVAIGQVTIGEPIVVDVEKFNRLRKQHLVPQGSKFDIDSDGTKYLYPMINPVRWDNEKPIKHRGIVSRKIQEQGVAEDREYIPSGKKRITRNGIDLVVSIDGATVDIRAMTGDSQMAYVVFDRDGDTLVADDLAVEEQYKGQGIAKIMYDYVKELGFRVKRSSDQLVAGKKFWDKNKGAENNIWEQGVAEGSPNFNREWDEATRYPEFVNLGKEKWIELVSKGKQVTVTRKNVNKINNTDAADPKSFKLLDTEKQKRALAQLANGDVEMPIVARYSDGYLELIGGNTRLTAQMAKDGQAKVWLFNVPEELTQGVTEGGEKYKVKRIGHDAKGDYYISPSTGKKVYKSGVERGDHENPNTGEIKKNVAEGANWSKHNNPRAGGMSQKSVKSYRRSHPGSKIQTAVTKKPSKLKKGSKDAKRRSSFCARMKGMKKHNTSAKTAHDPDSNINKSLRRWNCESVEQLNELVILAEQFIQQKRKAK